MDHIKPEKNLAVRAKGSKPERQDKKSKGSQDKKSKGKPAAANATDAKANADTKGMLQLIFHFLYPWSLTIPRLIRHSRGRPWTLVFRDGAKVIADLFLRYPRYAPLDHSLS